MFKNIYQPSKGRLLGIWSPLSPENFNSGLFICLKYEKFRYNLVKNQVMSEEEDSLSTIPNALSGSAFSENF